VSDKVLVKVAGAWGWWCWRLVVFVREAVLGQVISIYRCFSKTTRFRGVAGYRARTMSVSSVVCDLTSDKVVGLESGDFNMSCVYFFMSKAGVNVSRIAE
jgi:hypothetical protein